MKEMGTKWKSFAYPNPRFSQPRLASSSPFRGSFAYSSTVCLYISMHTCELLLRKISPGYPNSRLFQPQLLRISLLEMSVQLYIPVFVYYDRIVYIFSAIIQKRLASDSPFPSSSSSSSCCTLSVNFMKKHSKILTKSL